jgi:chromosome partitioning protein
LLAKLAKPAWQGLHACHGKPAKQGDQAWPGLQCLSANTVLPGRPATCHLWITMLVAFTNTKGGVGKSTLAAHLAIWLFDKEYRVALLDTDDQGTSSRWVQNAEPKIKVVTASEMEAIQKARVDLFKTHEIIVADTPGKESDAARTVTFLADIAIVPLQPSKPDLRAIKDALKGIRLAQEVRDGKRPKAVLVLNLTAKGDVQSRLLRRQLAESGFPVARSEVRRLNAFRDSCDTAVTRLKRTEAGEAASDIEALFVEILGEEINSMPERTMNEMTTNQITARAANE